MTGSHALITFCVALLVALAVTGKFRTTIIGPVAGAVAFGAVVLGSAMVGYLQL